MNDIPEINIEFLIERYAVILFDAFGVLANSAEPLPGAIEVIAELNRIAKPYYVLTNDAAALPTTRAKRYQRYGLSIGPERIITAGALLEGHFETHGLKGTSCVVLGTEDSVRFVENAGGRVVSPDEAFDVFVMGDQADSPFLERVNAVLTALFFKLDKGESVHLVLPNPDLIYPENDGFGMASGSVALMFEAALELRYPDRPDLRFVRLGKPYAAIYQEALRRSGTMDMVMIGDQLETDIRGANDFGLDSVLVSTGVTASRLSGIPGPLRPTYRLRSLTPSAIP